MSVLVQDNGSTYVVRGFWGFVVLIATKYPLRFFRSALYALPGFFIGATIGNSVGHPNLKTLAVQGALLVVLVIIILLLGIDDAWGMWKQGLKQGIITRTRRE